MPDVTTALSLVRPGLRVLPDLVRSRPMGRFSVADRIERAADRWPDAVAVREADRSTTFAELDRRANVVARWAETNAVARGTVVGLLMENRAEFLASWLGLAKLGAVTALFNTNLRADALALSVDTAGCSLVLVGTECADAWSSVAHRVEQCEPIWVADPGTAGEPSPSTGPPGRSFDAEIESLGSDRPPRDVRDGLRSSDPLFYIYTSGTTGLPKAARLSHSRFLGGGIYAMLAGLTRGDVLYCPLPLYHTVGGVMCVDAVLRSGATLALARRFSAQGFWDDVARYDATAFQYIGELCRYLVNQPPHRRERDHRLRFAVGNGLRPDVWEQFQSRFGVPRIVEFYGATESNVAMVNLQGRVGSVGKAPPGLHMMLVRYDVDRDEVVRGPDGRCVPCGTDEPGEMLGRISHGRSLAGRFEGYTSSAETERKILRDVVSDGDAWFRTGDLLRRDADGFHYFVDRVGDTFRWKGENVSTQEVAQAVTDLPSVDLCAVYGVEVPGAEGRAGMAAIVLASGAAFDGEAFFDGMSGALPAYARPAFVRIQDEPELTATFKLSKVRLRKEGYDPDAGTDQVLYRDDLRRAYLPVDREVVERIECGGIRF